MSTFSETILFPTQRDQFPNLEDSSYGAIKENQIVYAEHYNKVANLVQKVEPYLNNTLRGTSDGSISGISFTHTLIINVRILFSLVAKAASTNQAIVLPGNVLPFEFVYANNNDPYGGWIYAGQSSTKTWVQSSYVEVFNNLIGGLNFFTNYPMTTACVISIPNNGIGVQQHLPLSDYIVNAHTVLGSDTLILRGHIIDTGITNPPPANVAERWTSIGGNVWLNCSITGVKKVE